jgi:3-hydroxyacyl-CoA dehydrogenase/AcrR family transcriptional regulator
MATSLNAVGRRERNTADKRERIFRAAADLFAQRGFDRVSTQDVSDRADVATGTLFRYAASKGELLLMVFNEELRGAVEQGQQRAANELDITARVAVRVFPIIERATVIPENGAAYQRELLFGPDGAKYRSEGLSIIHSLERDLADELLDEAHARGVPANRDAALLAAASVFALTHLAIGRLSIGALAERNSVVDFTTQIHQIVTGFLTSAVPNQLGRGTAWTSKSREIENRNETMSSTIKRVTVLGTGVLGSQIAFQTAYSGFEVTAYDISDELLAKAKVRFEGLSKSYVTDGVAGAADGKTAEALTRLRYSSDLADAVSDADLVIEAIPEVLQLKQETYEKLGQVAPEKTIFATNSSTLLPSDLKDFTGRPTKFLALHFANQVWKFNTAEVMGTADTDAAVFDSVVEFASEIGMVPIPIHKEKAGYVLNSLLVPLLNAAAGLAAGGYAEPGDVDKVWRIATGAPIGPFQIYDIIGLTTPYNILAHGGPEEQAIADWLKTNYIDRGKLGLAAGEGFYTYPSA